MSTRTWLLGSVMFGSAAVWAAASSELTPYTVVSVGALVVAAAASSAVALLKDRESRRTRVVDIRPLAQRDEPLASAIDEAPRQAVPADGQPTDSR